MNSVPVLHRATLAALLLFSACACGGRELVGGPCSYLKQRGVAELVSERDGHYLLRFRLIGGERVDAGLMHLDGDEFEAEGEAKIRLAGAAPGTRFAALASVITRGTCTPVIYEIGARCKAGMDGCGD